MENKMDKEKLLAIGLMFLAISGITLSFVSCDLDKRLVAIEKQLGIK